MMKCEKGKEQRDGLKRAMLRPTRKIAVHTNGEEMVEHCY